MDNFLEFLFSGLVNGAIYALIALGFMIIYSATGVINFAQGEFVMLGAMITAWLSGRGWPLALMIVVALAGATLVGVLTERLALRPARTTNPLILIIITIGVSILIKGLAMFAWGKEPLPVRPFLSPAPLHLLGATLPRQGLLVLAVSALAFVATESFFRFTLWGKAMRACAYNRFGARVLGLNLSGLTALSFALSAALSGLAGIIISPLTFAAYDMGTMLGLKGFSAAVFGGLGSAWGALLGGFTLGVLEALAAGYLSSAYKDAVAFLLLLTVLFVKPEGLLSPERVEKL
ncbi:branched-chain amino acid ABC transporter permease [Thermosulfurimonas sp. F29]|uniref:branched-chain amino acid ABC transporter permease n=1 Tax=Thermosulfurimonas sp. F29 TaxID=2867247 RepID=UPI001C8406F4|nr:branched-chain amino acid ABC transporter permease [Thermosulfurimonas sp. F29]MBX6423023.1 branched-chain amino acid ABC transporter permease [Thermosulfurimonas sp. F29]